MELNEGLDAQARRTRLEQTLKSTILRDDPAILNSVLHGPMDDKNYQRLSLILLTNLGE